MSAIKWVVIGGVGIAAVLWWRSSAAATVPVPRPTGTAAAPPTAIPSWLAPVERLPLVGQFYAVLQPVDTHVVVPIVKGINTAVTPVNKFFQAVGLQDKNCVTDGAGGPPHDKTTGGPCKDPPVYKAVAGAATSTPGQVVAAVVSGGITPLLEHIF